MTDYVWPDDLVPYQQGFWLQPHTGGTESPFSRQTKVYGLGAPRWMCSMSFRGGYDGTRAQAAFGPRLDALLAKLKGRQNRIAIWDFRRSKMRSPLFPAKPDIFSGPIEAAETTTTIGNLLPGTKIYAGDYIGGDGRPHIITDDAIAGASGGADVNFEPPFKVTVAQADVVFAKVSGMFRLISDDAGDNMVEVGGQATLTLDFVEDL